ncbi:nitroreductase family deazaflavin-dependent oxidoreductase [Nocardia sp. BMG111209]|uniref:nitroreductase family deazaflavin-dependent oxidoreductase n=1 Tax=Nocardia sp. BMG111209 TaxID=1160137 RepID=UPI0003679E9D|nr:nitroreductase family deazaflavin-dependent oxidoreductase [Nocardia sp. BMG111209]
MTTNPYGTPSTSGPMPMNGRQHLVNRFVRGLFRLPVLGGLVGRRLLILYVVGRKTGKEYAIPLAYTRHDGALVIGARKHPWVRNLRADVPVQISTGGPRRTADAKVFTDAENVQRLYEVVARDNRQNARYNGIGFDADGNPNKADLYQTWQLGGAIVQLTPR